MLGDTKKEVGGTEIDSPDFFTRNKNYLLLGKMLIWEDISWGGANLEALSKKEGSEKEIWNSFFAGCYEYVNC